jgi:predicted metallo-beta-lactamase superfamily hydrolase
MNDELAKKNPMIVELKKRVNVYYKITVKNLREVVPKNIRSILIERLLRDIEYEIFQSCLGEKEQVQSWLKLNTGEI